MKKNGIRINTKLVAHLLYLLGVAGILNHIWNTGESLFQPVCITVIGAAAAGASFRKRGDHWNSEED